MSEFSEAIITRVVVRGFRSLENVTVDLDKVTVLVGPNGSGKSSFVDALAFLQQSLTASPQEAFQSRGGVEQVLTQTGQRPVTISIEVHIQSRAPGDFAGTYFVKFETKERRKKLSLQESCEMTTAPERALHRFAVANGKWQQSVEGMQPRLAENRLALPLMSSLEYFAPMYHALTSMIFYAVTPQALRIWQEPDAGAQLASDGGNAASVLRQLSKDEMRYGRVLQALAKIVPSVHQVSLKRRGRMLKLVFQETFVGHTELRFEADGMSDGTLRALGILLAAYQEQSPTLVGFDEPEASIHPGAAAVLAEALQEAGLRTQVLVTTQSPDLVTRFNVETLRAVERKENGTTVIAPIAESQLASIREGLFTAGELHRIEGLRPASVSAEE